MKKIAVILLLIFSFSVTTIQSGPSGFVCPATELKSKIKPLLKPDYKYDSSKITRITYKAEKQLKEIEIPLFIGEKYKFIFNTAELPEDVVINVYNKKAGKKNRDLLYSNKEEMEKNGNQEIFTFTPDRSRTMYINYEIPSTSTMKQGCVVFLLGYRG